MIYFITGNNKKFQECEEILGKGTLQQIAIDLPELQETNPKKIIEHKLFQALDHCPGPVIIEDTSLYLDCLGGRLPGPLIKWFLKELGNKGIYELTKKYKNFKATATVMIGYAKNKQEMYFFEGSVEGMIGKESKKKGFGWDSIFYPKGYKISYSEMSQEEKNKISMRKVALTKLKNFLKKHHH